MVNSCTWVFFHKILFKFGCLLVDEKGKSESKSRRMLPLIELYLSVGVAGPAMATPISQYLVRFPTICTLDLPLYQGTVQLYDICTAPQK
jgi:hypothetical protein